MTETNFEPGIYDISNEIYHASSGLSRSALWTFRDLPKKYWYKYISGLYEEPKESKAYALGNAVHSLLLEPHKFDDNYCVMPEIDRRTKIGKIEYASFMMESGNKSHLTTEQRDTSINMAESVLQNPMVSNILRPINNVMVEKSIYWKDLTTGLLLKCRPDAFKNSLVIEIKTCDDASPRGFQLSATKYGYYLQAACVYEGLLSIGIKMEHYMFVCVEKEPPFATALYRLDDDALQYGLDLLCKIKSEFKKCQDSGVFPDYGLNMLGVPTWALREIENE
jgi:exodeoxyribonuclease VIII